MSTADRSHAQLVEIADNQAATLNRQAEEIRDLMAQVRRAEADKEAADDLAAQFARAAGHDLTADKRIAYTAWYWEFRRRMDRENHQLEGQRWECLQLSLELGRVDLSAMDAVTLGTRIADWLRNTCTAQGPKKRDMSRLFTPPTIPGLELSAPVEAVTKL